MLRGAAWSLSVFFLVALAAEAEPVKVTVSPPAGWVAPLSYDPRALIAPVDPAFDCRWLLKSSEINVKLEETFVHNVQQVLTAAGARAASHLAINFDPGCQTLTFHWVRLWRNGVALNRLDASMIESGPPSADAPSFLFGSMASANLMISGAQPGDLLDYAYTIQRSNPALHGHFASAIALQADEPADRLVTLVFWPPPRRLYIQNHNTSAEPLTDYKSNLVQFTWEQRQVPGLRLEPQTPSWYNPYPWVELSEFPAWANVNHWGMELFAGTNASSPEFTRQVAEWRKLSAPEEQALAALRFVQADIGSAPPAGDTRYEAADPSLVLARQIGDDADKARLLVAFLRALKIPAAPVLVNTRWRQTISDWHASPLLFDHALVQATINGVVYWMDPGAAYEQGPLARASWPNCGCGLAIKPDTDSLSSIPPPPLPATRINEFFTLMGVKEDSGLKVVTEFDGMDADFFRWQLATTERTDLEHDYRIALEKAYPDILTASPLTFSNDDSQRNRIVSVEFYRIPNMWIHLPDEAFFHCDLYATDLKSALEPPIMPVRSQPQAIPYPFHRTVHIETTLGDTVIPVNSETQTVESPAFVFRRTINQTGNVLTIDYDYRTLTDVLEPEGVAYYVTQLESASKLLSYTLLSY